MHLTQHKTNECNDQIDLVRVAPDDAWDRPLYEARLPDGTVHVLQFQHGPIKEVGVNGTTNEVLLAVVADRLRGFQSSEYACRENALALTKIEEALHWMHHRTRERALRGVEGTSHK